MRWQKKWFCFREQKFQDVFAENGLEGTGIDGHDEIFGVFFFFGKGHIEKPIILTFLLFGISINEPCKHLRWNISMWPK